MFQFGEKSVAGLGSYGCTEAKSSERWKVRRHGEALEYSVGRRWCGGWRCWFGVGETTCSRESALLRQYSQTPTQSTQSFNVIKICNCVKFHVLSGWGPLILNTYLSTIQTACASELPFFGVRPDDSGRSGLNNELDEPRELKSKNRPSSLVSLIPFWLLSLRSSTVVDHDPSRHNPLQ